MSAFADDKRRLHPSVDLNRYLDTDELTSEVTAFALDQYEDPLFLTNSRCHYHIWRLGSNHGSSIMAITHAVGVVTDGLKGVDGEPTVGDVFKSHVRTLLEEHKTSLCDYVEKGPLHHYLVVSKPAKVEWKKNDEGEDEIHMTADLGFFSVPKGIHVRLYGRAVEIPQPTISVTVGDGENLSERDIDYVLGASGVSDKEIEDVVGPTLAKAELDKERKTLTNELMGFAVDLLKAGSGKYDGEAAQTLRNLVQERLKEVSVEPPWGLERAGLKHFQEVFLTKALVRLVDLSKFVLAEDKHEYFGKRSIEKVSQMKVERGIRLHHGPKVQVIRPEQQTSPFRPLIRR